MWSRDWISQTMFTHTHTRICRIFSNYLQSPCIFISVSFWWVFSKRGYQQRVCLEWNSIRRQLRNSRLIEVNGFRIMPSIGKRIINTTKKQNKRNKSNEKLQRLSYFKFSFQTFFEKQKISQCTTRFNELFPRIGYKTAKSRTRSKSIQVFVIF